MKKAKLCSFKSVFVGGIPGEIEKASLYDYFSSFGSVLDITIPKKRSNPMINSGFCFITFRETRSKLQVIAVGDHLIEGRRVSCKEYFPEQLAQNHHKLVCNRKLFVKFIPENMTEDQFRAFFERFGQLESYYLVRYDSMSKKNLRLSQMNSSNNLYHYSFGYLVYKDQSVSIMMASKKTIKIGNKKMVIQRFQKNPLIDDSPKENQTKLKYENAEKAFNHNYHLRKPTSKQYRQIRSGIFEYGAHLQKPQFSPYRFNISNLGHSAPKEPNVSYGLYKKTSPGKIFCSTQNTAPIIFRF